MDRGKPLFDVALDPYGPPKFVVHSETSRAAAAEAEDSGLAVGARDRVLRQIRKQSVHGATDEELQDLLQMNPSTQRPRRVELETAGLIVARGERMTKSGRRAAVWVAKEFA